MVASHALPTGDLACNPGMCPDGELNQRAFGSQASVILYVNKNVHSVLKYLSIVLPINLTIEILFHIEEYSSISRSIEEIRWFFSFDLLM